MRSRPFVGRVLGVALTWVPACTCTGAVEAEPLARAIEAELAAQGLVASVTCPAEVEAARVGQAVACTAVAKDDPGGTALVVRAQILDDTRIALAPEAALAIGGAAGAIRSALAGLGIEATRIDCGGALARAGDPLSCDIDASDGRRLTWRAVLDAEGRARGELVPR